MRIEIDNKKINLPDFLIVGAAKSGTTSLYYYLKKNPYIFMSESKEPWFFTFVDNPPEYISPDPLAGVIFKTDQYIELFKNAKDNQIIGEASPSYLYKYEESIKNIKRLYGENYKKLKIIIIIRNPARRAWSMYNHFKKNLNEPLEFKKAINSEIIRDRMKNNWNIFYDYIGVGEYYDQINAYFTEFSNVKIFLFEELQKDSLNVIKEITDFLGVDSNLDLKHGTKIYNKSGQFNNKYKLLLPFYKWYINPDNLLRRNVKKILPLKIRRIIDRKIQECFLKRYKMDRNLEKQIINRYYMENIKKLQNLLKDKKELLQLWINKAEE